MLNKALVTLGVGGILALIVALFVVGPILSIFAVNQLFGTSIAINFWNWVSVMWLHIVVASSRTSNNG